MGVSVRRGPHTKQNKYIYQQAENYRCPNEQLGERRNMAQPFALHEHNDGNQCRNWRDE